MIRLILILLSLIGTKNFIYSQPIVRIAGTKDPLAVEKEVLWYLDQLEVQEHIHLTVIFTTIIPERLSGLTYCRNVLAEDGRKVIMVRIDKRLQERQQQLMLAHEMIHVKQYAKEELKVLQPDRVTWKGKRYTIRKIEHKGPWEKEAYRNDRVLAIQFQQRPDITLAAGDSNEILKK